MEAYALVALRTGGLQAPKADLPSHTSWRPACGPPPPTTPRPLPRGALAGRPPSESGQPGQAYGRGGWGEIPYLIPAATPRSNPAAHRTRGAAAPGVDSQIRHDGAAAPGHPDPSRPSTPSAGQAGAGTGMGSAVRAE